MRPIPRLAALALSLFTVNFAAQPVPPAAPAPAPSPAPAVPPAPLPNDPPLEPGVLRPGLPTIFLAGDSTAARYKPTDAHQGWGTPFANYLNPDRVNFANRALGGRSSRTFITQGWWDKLLADVKPGDWVLIQFGHNDGGAINDDSRARGTLRGTGPEKEEIDNLLTNRRETVLTYGGYLRRMIDDLRARGAQPVLMSSTVRNIWTDGKVERGGDFRAWARTVAAEEAVPFVDVRRLVADEWQRLGPGKVAGFHPKDHTHFNAEGAELVARQIVRGIAGLRGRNITEWLNDAGRALGRDEIGWLNLPEPRDPQRPTLLLIGDSTVRNGRGDGAGGQWGWGEPLAELVDPKQINVVNRAIGGLSSRTFLTQGHWERALTLLKRGDVLLLQFGHNDSAPLNDAQRARGTIKGTGDETETIDNELTKQRETVGTYGSYLRRYVREAKAAGVTPVICTLVPRKKWQEGRIVRSGDSYAAWARTVAAEEGVELIDLNELVAARYDALGAAEVDKLFADEHTHTSRAGAELNAQLVLEQLKATAAGRALFEAAAAPAAGAH